MRFGQFTIFLPALLKPAPTRLRLVLWGLQSGAEEFAESPPPGLVTIPVIEGIAPEVYSLSGYRPAGARAIRIDMLERLADQLRAQNTRAGFEANPDMLSITGMTLAQFADLMQGLGYKAERGHRPKVRSTDHAADATGPSEVEAQPWSDRPAEPHPGEHGVSEVEAIPEADGAGHSKHLHIDHLEGSGFSSVEAQPDVDDDDEFEPHPGVHGISEAETNVEPGNEPETFFTFSWGGFAKRQGGDGTGGRGGKPRSGGGGAKGGGKPRKPRGAPKGGGGGGAGKAQNFQARPPKKDRPIDPDNPFAAALMGLKDKT